ncbi:hypothetical protein AAZX31_11G160600 [Glycine max]
MEDSGNHHHHSDDHDHNLPPLVLLPSNQRHLLQVRRPHHLRPPSPNPHLHLPSPNLPPNPRPRHPPGPQLHPRHHPRPGPTIPKSSHFAPAAPLHSPRQTHPLPRRHRPLPLLRLQQELPRLRRRPLRIHPRQKNLRPLPRVPCHNLPPLHPPNPNPNRRPDPPAPPIRALRQRLIPHLAREDVQFRRIPHPNPPPGESPPRHGRTRPLLRRFLRKLEPHRLRHRPRDEFRGVALLPRPARGHWRGGLPRRRGQGVCEVP